MADKRKIQLYPFIENLHTVHNSIITYPPEGYEVIGVKMGKVSKLADKTRHSRTIRFLYHLFLKVVKTTKIIDATQTAPILSEADLVLTGAVLYKPTKPWVLYMLDHPTSLAGNNYSLFLANKSRIEQALLLPECRKIVVTNESPIEFMEKHFSKELVDKAMVIRPAIEDNSSAEKKTEGKTKVLFMGSINNPQDFYIKGGLEVIKVFEKLSTRKDSEFIIRCRVPEELKARILKISNVKLIDEKIPFKELLELYSSSDILFMPGHNYSVTVFIEGMSFSLPIIALNTYAVKDFVKPGYNGLIVQRSEKVQGYNHPGYPAYIRNDKFMEEIMSLDDPELIDRLSKALVGLIEDKKLRKKLSLNARKEFVEKYTIDQRNKDFKKLFDKILAE